MTPAPESLEELVSRMRRLLDAARLEVLGAASGMVGPMPASGALNAETMRVLPLLLDSTERMLKYEKERDDMRERLTRLMNDAAYGALVPTERMMAWNKLAADLSNILAASPSPPQKG